MIPIRRIPAPRAIETARVRKLPEAVAKFGAGVATPTREDFAGYDAAREPYWEHQREKCAYCDRDVALGGQPVEHFRPILGGYWWLAWDWTNLLFACVTCNGAKSNSFPLLSPGVRLTPGQPPPGPERPYLANPYDEDPMALVGFKEDEDEAGRWVPCGLDPDGRGEKIIETLGLMQHVPAYSRWVTDTLVPDLEAIRDAIEAGVAEAVQAAWDDFWLRHDTEYTRFRSLTRAVAAHWFPADVRAQWGLQRGPPQAEPLPLAAGARQEWALLDELPDSTRELVYALGGRAADDAWERALPAVLSSPSAPPLQRVDVFDGWREQGDDLCVQVVEVEDLSDGLSREIDGEDIDAFEDLEDAADGDGCGGLSLLIG